MLITNWTVEILWLIFMAILWGLWYTFYVNIIDTDYDNKYSHSFWKFYLFECNIFSRICNWVVTVCFVWNICRVVYTLLSYVR